MPAPDGDSRADNFHTTHWSLVIAAGKQSEDALARLCEAYWPPLYAFIRRSGYPSHAAQDLTQEFFARLLDKQYLHAADRERGRFRSFLLGAVKHFLSNQRKAERAQKRGGGQRQLSLDFGLAEAAYQLEPADVQTPERLFERQWALLLLERVVHQLTAEYEAAGKSQQIALLKDFITAGSDHRPYATVADELQTTEAAVKMSVQRLKKRYRELLRCEIGQTVAAPSEVDEELAQLFEILARR